MKQVFCNFRPNFFEGFYHLRPVRPLYPSFFIYFHVSCILGRTSNLWKFGFFVDLSLFFGNWSMCFCCGMIYNGSIWINLINLLNWENLEFLGFETTWIGDFVQLGIIWWNWLVRLINLIIIFCYLTCVMINWSIYWNLYKWFFKILGFLLWNDIKLFLGD